MMEKECYSVYHMACPHILKMIAQIQYKGSNPMDVKNWLRSLTHTFLFVGMIVGLLCIVLTSLFGIFWKNASTPWTNLHHAAASMPSFYYTDMLTTEIARTNQLSEGSMLATRYLIMFLVQLSIGVDPQDTRSWAAQVLPGVQPEHTIVIHGVGTTAGDYPLEVPPAADFTDDFEYINVLPEVLYTAPPIEHPADNQASPSPSPSIDEFEAEPIFFIYHSHPSESFLPELPGVSEVDRAYAKLSSGVTVTALGSRLREEFTLLGLRSLHSDQDYPWEGAYQASRKTVKAAMAEHADLQFFIDIHRDAARKDKTTIDVNGVRYARFYLVIGQKNPQYKENLAFAQQLHRRIEDKMVGLSRGVVLKKAGSNGEFNQSLSPQSIVVEIGGVDNTLEEGFRSVAVLAEVLAEMYWEQGDAVEVIAPQKSQ